MRLCFGIQSLGAIIKWLMKVQFNQPHSSPPPYTSPTPSDEPSAPSVGPVSEPEFKPESYPSTGDAVRNVTGPVFSASSSGHDLAIQLAEAKATIARLQDQIKQDGLRLRKTSAVASDSKPHIAEGATGTSLTTHPPEGVSVQICAALCLVTFLLAYVFF